MLKPSVDCLDSMRLAQKRAKHSISAACSDSSGVLYPWSIVRLIGRGVPVIVAPECASAHSGVVTNRKRLLQSRIRRRRRSGMTRLCLRIALQPIPILRTRL
jgi:hypothetical protein